MINFDTRDKAVKYVEGIFEVMCEDPTDYDIDGFVDSFMCNNVDGVEVYQVEDTLENAVVFWNALPDFLL